MIEMHWFSKQELPAVTESQHHRRTQLWRSPTSLARRRQDKSYPSFVDKKAGQGTVVFRASFSGSWKDPAVQNP